VVVQNGAHMVNLVGLDAAHAHILDSNFPERIQQRPRADFLRDWQQSGGWAVTPVGSPMPPSPWMVRETAGADASCQPGWPGLERSEAPDGERTGASYARLDQQARFPRRSPGLPVGPAPATQIRIPKSKMR
jgi:hypothetical protein